MALRNSVLIVDELPEKRRFLRRAAEGYLDPREWEIVEADSLTSGLEAVERLQEHLGLALIHASLEEPARVEQGRRVYEGLKILDRIGQLCGDSRSCYKILVSTYITDRKELADQHAIDDFVHIRYRGTRNPVDELQAALQRGTDCIRGKKVAGSL